MQFRKTPNNKYTGVGNKVSNYFLLHRCNHLKMNEAPWTHFTMWLKPGNSPELMSAKEPFNTPSPASVAFALATVSH